MIIRGNTVGTNMSVDRIAEKIGGTGSNTLIVTMDNVGLATHSSTQIANHIRNGGTAIARYYQGMFGLGPIDDFYFSRCYEDEQNDGSLVYYVEFVSTVADTLRTLTIDENKAITVSYLELATYKDIGNISSALDDLHTYAQGLINGDVVEEVEPSTPISPKPNLGGDTE